jgi:hypothetical protein
MSTTTGAIQVRTVPTVKIWQALALAAAIALSVLLGLIIGRATAEDGGRVTPAVTTTFDPAEFGGALGRGHVIPRPTFDPDDYAQFAGTGHVPPR